MALPTVFAFGIDLVSFFIFLGILFGLFLTISLTINLEFGYTGIPNFGKVMFVSAGGSIGGAFAYRFTEWILQLNTHGDDIAFNAALYTQMANILSKNFYLAIGILLLTLVVAAGVGAIVGYLASYPAIKLREDYLGMLLLASGEFYQIFLRSYYPLIGGGIGILLPDTLGWSSSLQGVRDLVGLVLIAILAILVFLYAERVAKSPLGRTLRAIRDNETASEALGKDNVAIRRRVLVIASAISAVAGAMYAMYLAHVDPDLFSREVFTFWPWVMVILGGSGNNVGVALGALSFATIYDVILNYQVAFQGTGAHFFLPISIQRFQPLAFGLLLIVILLVRPDGILREKSTMTISKSKIEDIMIEEGQATRSERKGGRVRRLIRRLRKPPKLG
jgi:branched-chain amino acid transport system permease protein